MQAHPLAELFPMLPDAEIRELADDMVTFGQRVPIVLLDGQVLDGRNRLAACRHAAIEPVFEDYAGDDPFSFVISQNLHRRHLTTSQRAMVAARIVDWRNGTNQHTARPANLPVWKAASAFKVSERQVRDARAVESTGDPQLIAEVRRGGMSVHRALRLAKLTRDQQRSAIRNQSTSPARAAVDIRLRNGRRLSEITWGDLGTLIRRNVEEAHLLQLCAAHAANADISALVTDVISQRALEKIIQEAGYGDR